MVRRNPKSQSSEDKGRVDVEIFPVQYYGFKSDRPELKGYTFVGSSPEQALINARAFFSTYYAKRGHSEVHIYVKESNGDRTERT